MAWRTRWLPLPLVALSLGMPFTGVTQESESPDYSRAGADTCLNCHDDSPEFSLLAIFESRHAVTADERTPFAQLQCESCHGPGGEHAGRVRRGQERPPMVNFGREAETPIGEQNEVCLGCHAGHIGAGWAGSVHESDDVGCADCHAVHIARDPVFNVAEQPEVCYPCHLRQRADVYRPYVHPIRFGKMACTACHNPHESITEAALIRQELNETCYSCHAEKRGPYLWEHPPAAEDCSLCHVPHGSNHPALLTKRPPLLCQQCHSQAGHPSIAYTARGLASGNPSPYLLAGSCLNCHAQVHGSNHPSGVNLNR